MTERNISTHQSSGGGKGQEKYPDRFRRHPVPCSSELVSFYSNALTKKLSDEVNSGRRSIDRSDTDMQKDPLEYLQGAFMAASISAEEAPHVQISFDDLYYLRSLTDRILGSGDVTSEDRAEVYRKRLELERRFDPFFQLSLANSENDKSDRGFLSKLFKKA